MDRFTEGYIQLSLSVARHPHFWVDVPGNENKDLERFGILLTLPNREEVWLKVPRSSQRKPRADELANWTHIAEAICGMYGLMTV
jgi:hypothetical protein